MSALHELVRRYGPEGGEDGPVLFVREMFQVEPDPWQIDTLRAFGRRERRISIRSAHGPGKTALAAWLVLLMLATRYPQKSVATAPSRAQLEDALVVEVMKWYQQLPLPIRSLFEVKKNRIELIKAPANSFFSARTAREEKPEALQGVHSDSVLLIVDEASGVPESIFEAGIGSMSGHNATTLLLSNPVRTSGFFYETHHSLSDMWYRVHVSAFDSPRISKDFINDVARRYGEESNTYRVRVLGEFPSTEQDTVIPWEYVESARQRDIIMPPGLTEIWGLDIARFGDDKNVLLRRTKLAVHPDILVWDSTDLMQTAGRVVALWESMEPGHRPEAIYGDVLGVGAGVIDRLRELGLPAIGINSQETAASSDRFFNLRSELWWKFREWLELRNTALPREGEHAETLAKELTRLRYDFTSSGKIKAEPKRDVKKRGYRSPNIADAAIYTMAGEPSRLLYGSKGTWHRHNWNEPLRPQRSVF